VPQKADEMLTAMKETREGKDAQMAVKQLEILMKSLSKPQ